MSPITSHVELQLGQQGRLGAGRGCGVGVGVVFSELTLYFVTSNETEIALLPDLTTLDCEVFLAGNFFLLLLGIFLAKKKFWPCEIFANIKT